MDVWATIKRPPCATRINVRLLIKAWDFDVEVYHAISNRWTCVAEGKRYYADEAECRRDAEKAEAEYRETYPARWERAISECRAHALAAAEE
jgi:hypothetical protein